MILKKFINLFLIFFFNLNFNLFSKNYINITKMKFMNTLCGHIFSSKVSYSNFLLFEIESIKNDFITFEIDLKDEKNYNFLIEGEDKTKNKYKIDKEEDIYKNKNFELRLDLKNEKIEIQEISYDMLNKKNIYSNDIFIFDLKDFTCVIYKLTKKVRKIIKVNINGALKDVEKEVDEDKYIFCNDCNTFKVEEENFGMFYKPLGNNYYKVSVEWVSKNKDKWTKIFEMFRENKFIEEVDFGDFDYKFEDISFCFAKCENLKYVKNLKKLFNDNLKKVEYFFHECKNIETADISDVKLPEDSGCFFAESSVKNLKYDNLDLSKCKNLEAFFWGNNIEEFDFTKIKNAENIENLQMFFCDCKNLKKVIFNNIEFKKSILIDQMFDHCENLDEIIGFENIKLKVKRGDYVFKSCKNLKKLDLSNIIISGNSERMVDFKYIKDLILPNDPNSAKLIINEIKKFFNTPRSNKDNQFCLFYKCTKLENVSELDDLDEFINDSENYIKNRNEILANKRVSLSDEKNNYNMNNDTLKTIGCCSKCCFCCNCG